MTVRALSAADGRAFQALRLRGLHECPSAFASSYAEECGAEESDVAARLESTSDRAVFGYHNAGALCGIVGLQRESMVKLSHKAFIWGLYVAPEARRSGAGRELMQVALAYAARKLQVRQVLLGVNTRNAAAIALYKSLGFQVFGTEPGFLQVQGEFHDEHHMFLPLGGAAR